MRYELIRYVDKHSPRVPAIAFRSAEPPTRGTCNRPPGHLLTVEWPSGDVRVQQFSSPESAVTWFRTNHPDDSLEWPGTSW